MKKSVMLEFGRFVNQFNGVVVEVVSVISRQGEGTLLTVNVLLKLLTSLFIVSVCFVGLEILQ